VVESPYEDFDDDFTRLRACEIALDRSRSTAAWRVDGRTVYEAHGTLIPEHARIGFGILDDAADPRLSQSLARRAGHERAVAPVPSARGRSRRGPGSVTSRDRAIEPGA
jgi:hypothetical protein